MRIGAYADGVYFCKCVVCSETFHGDKHAVNCLRCAVEQLQAELDKALKALRNLHDVQNGPPLLRHEKQWQAAYDEAGNVLEEMEQ